MDFWSRKDHRQQNVWPSNVLKEERPINDERTTTAGKKGEEENALNTTSPKNDQSEKTLDAS
jgi:hypothetical protein